MQRVASLILTCEVENICSIYLLIMFSLMRLIYVETLIMLMLLLEQARRRPGGRCAADLVPAAIMLVTPGLEYRKQIIA